MSWGGGVIAAGVAGVVVEELESAARIPAATPLETPPGTEHVSSAEPLLLLAEDGR
jgi:hypothetical protein